MQPCSVVSFRAGFRRVGLVFSKLIIGQVCDLTRENFYLKPVARTDDEGGVSILVLPKAALCRAALIPLQ